MKKLNPVPKIFQPGLMERGKIKIGQKGQWKKSKGGSDFQLPEKLDHFKVVTLQRGEDGNFLLDREVHYKYGDQPTELKIWLLFDDLYLNFQSRLTRFSGRQCVCQGDGESSIYIDQNGEQQEGYCPCEKIDPQYTGNDACKINSKLSCQISGVESVGGVYTFRTTSYNSFQSILSSLLLIQRVTCGPLAQIPLLMQLRPKTVTIPTTGKTQIVYIVALEYAGTIEALQSTGEQIRLQSAQHMQRLEKIEARAAQIVSPDFETESQEEVADEYFPEAAQEDPPQHKTQPDQSGSSAQENEATQSGEHTDRSEVLVHSGNHAGEADHSEGDTDKGTQGYPHGGETTHTEGQDSYTPEDSPQESQKSESPKDGQEGQSEGESTTTQSPPKPQQQGGRRRTKEYEVDKNEFGVSELKTCGITPDQIGELKRLSREDKINEQKINGELRRIGYNKVSFLRYNEADSLIQSMKYDTQSSENEDHTENQSSASMPLPDHINDEAVECPERSNKEVSVDECCYCGIRKKNGFCPALDEEPPDQNVL